MAEMQRGMDLAVAAELCRMSARYFRAALDAEPDRRDSAINLELARRTAAEIEAERAEAEELRKKLQEAMKEIVDLLKQLIARQEALVKRADSMEPADADPDSPVLAVVTEEQRTLRTDTQSVHDRMEEVDKLFPQLPDLPKNAPPEMISPMGAAIRHMKEAVAAQDRALTQLAQRLLPPAGEAMREALAALRRALEAMPAPQENDPSQGDPSDEETGEEEEFEESEEEGDQQSDQVKPDQPPEDEEFTAPKEAPEDILLEEQLNNQMRQQKRPENFQVVEKDW
jgi:hypothetical protein